MSRNLVLCCDGTANEIAKHNTNVVKLYSVLAHDTPEQCAYYHPGLGTREAAGALTTVARKLTKVLGLMFGYGLADDVRDAYVFLMNNYEPGDRIFLFGFSRGAYTARSIASMLHLFGLIRKGNDAFVPYVVRMMLAIERGLLKNKKDKTNEYFDLARQFRDSMARPCAVHFVGVWDTVSSVGWIGNPLHLPYVTDNPSIAIGRHAIAIDERRAFFRTHLWRPSGAREHGPKDMKQVWFPGVHCDVGGGYPEAESGLSKIALEWMLAEAIPEGLLVDRARVESMLDSNNTSKYTKPDANGTMHESLTGFWRLAEFVPKLHYNWKWKMRLLRMNLFRRRTIDPKSLVHDAAFQRKDNYASRLPKDAVRVTTPPLFPHVEGEAVL